MATAAEDTVDAEQRIRDLAGNLRAHRQRGCLLFVSRSIQHGDVLAVRSALEDEAGEHLDLIVSGKTHSNGNGTTTGIPECSRWLRSLRS